MEDSEPRISKYSSDKVIVYKNQKTLFSTFDEKGKTLSRGELGKNRREACTFNGEKIKSEVMNSLFSDMWTIVEHKYEFPIELANDSEKKFDERFDEWLRDFAKKTNTELPTYEDENGNSKITSWDNFIRAYQEEETLETIFKITFKDDIEYYMHDEIDAFEIRVHNGNFEKEKIDYAKDAELRKFITQLYVPREKGIQSYMQSFIKASNPDVSTKFEPMFSPEEYTEIQKKWQMGECFISIMDQRFKPDQIDVISTSYKHYFDIYNDPDLVDKGDLPPIMLLRYSNEEHLKDFAISPLRSPRSFQLCNGNFFTSREKIEKYVKEEIESPWVCEIPDDVQSHIHIPNLTVGTVDASTRVKSVTKRNIRDSTSKHGDIRGAMREENTPLRVMPSQIGVFLDSNTISKDITNTFEIVSDDTHIIDFFKIDE